MKNINNYIFEKFKISNDIENINNFLPLAIMEKYLDKMIITDEEKYIIKEVKKVIQEWLEENNIKEVYCYLSERDFKKCFENKKVNISFNDYFTKIPYITKSALENKVRENTVYHKKMKNQMVRLTICSNKDILIYYDSFLNNPILFVNKEYKEYN